MAQDFQKSIDFYTQLLQKPLDKSFKDRWAQIRISDDLTLGILGANFDKDFIKKGENISQHYDQNFIDNLDKNYNSGNSLVINLGTKKLEAEHRRLKSLNSRDISPIQYVNFMFPYRFFTVKDPDGNIIEIADSV